MRTLVTGSAGRFGRSVVGALAAAGHEVIGVDTVPGTPPEAAGTMPADLTDLGEAYGIMNRFRPEAVVHLAAVATPFTRTDGFTFQTNSRLAFNVCEAACATGVSRVVVASSPTVIGYGTASWAPSYLPLDEAHPAAPWNAYNLSKLVAEHVMAAFARSHPQVGLAAIRPCFVVAPEEWEGAPTQSGHTIRERLDRTEIAGASLFNYVDARDAADLVVTLTERLTEVPSGEVFFAGAGDALARAPLAELLPRVIPSTAGFAATLTGSAPAFSSAKAERLLGWQAKRSWRTELGDLA